MTTTSLPTLIHPGLSLGSSNTYSSGPGTHLSTDHTQIIASLAGRPVLIPPPAPQTTNFSPSTSSTSLPTITIPRLLPSLTHSLIPSANVTNTNTLPKVGDVVLCRVTRVRTRQVEVVILAVGRGNGEGGGEDVCADEWQAVLRKEDVRATEREKVVCAESFRVGDLMRGVVISLGDQSNYYLTTAKNELGVIMAKSEAGNTMYPISWKEFRDAVTGEAERRKVAKPL